MNRLLWDEYFNEGSISSIVNLYNKESTLFPTFSNQILTDREKIKEYFYKVLIEEKVSVETIFDSVTEEKIGENIFLLVGNYFFKFRKNKIVKARFSFIISLLSDNPIIHHHSSRIPID